VIEDEIKERNKFEKCVLIFSSKTGIIPSTFRGKIVTLLSQAASHEDVWASDEGEWSASRPDRFTRWETTLIPIGYEAKWAPEPIWMR
jgi:hypothetical protein